MTQDFGKEKQRQIEEDAPKIEDTSLPGWVCPTVSPYVGKSLTPPQGSWGGKGLRKRRVDPRFLIQKPGIEPSTRKDFKRTNVIINEKKDKRAHQFLVKDLPYPYTSVAQYERSFDMPLGSEWNSRTMHQRETMPRVVKKVCVRREKETKMLIVDSLVRSSSPCGGCSELDAQVDQCMQLFRLIAC